MIFLGVAVLTLFVLGVGLGLGWFLSRRLPLTRFEVRQVTSADTVVINGTRYLPETSIPPESFQVAVAVATLTTALTAKDPTSVVLEALNTLAPDIHALALKDPVKATAVAHAVATRMLNAVEQRVLDEEVAEAVGIVTTALGRVQERGTADG